MTDQEKTAMNVAIAEKIGKVYEIGAFTESLDACAEFEKTLDSRELERYASWLCLWITGGTSVPDILLPMSKVGAVACATPLQRAEAFCRLHKIGPFAEGKG